MLHEYQSINMQIAGIRERKLQAAPKDSIYPEFYVATNYLFRRSRKITTVRIATILCKCNVGVILEKLETMNDHFAALK